MEMTELVKMYLELGILGLCAIVTVFISIKSYTHIKESDEATREEISKQNKEFQENLTKNFELLLDKVVNGVVSHVPTKEENEKLTRVSEEINLTLQQMLIRSNASRAYLVQYHNGGKGVNKQSFLKMSITNEQVNKGIKPFMPDFKDQFRSVYSYFTKEIGTNGHCYINDYMTMQDVDSSMYEFLNDRGVDSIFGYAIRSNQDDYMIGYLCLEFTDKSKADLETIESVFKDNYNVIETLLVI